MSIIDLYIVSTEACVSIIDLYIVSTETLCVYNRPVYSKY